MMMKRISLLSLRSRTGIPACPPRHGATAENRAGKNVCPIKLRGAALFALLCALVLAAAPPLARAQGSRKDDIAIGPRGLPLAGASVAICTQPAVTTTTPCSPLATLYSNAALTQALANPLTTDGLGNYNFYATPGKYTVQIYGPNLTTKVMPDVILPSDPSSPTFATVTTTSGITAFSLSLAGNLTVSGNTAVTGTLTVGGAPVPSTAQDLQWSNNQRFKGPIPERDITAYGPPGGCPQLYYFAPPSGTIASGSHSLTISGGVYSATNGCGVAVYGAGPSSTLTTPGTVTVAAHSYTGSTTYCYEVAAVDNNFGMSAASAHTCIANGVATLGRDSYNFLNWTAVSNAVAYVIYESATSGGTYNAIGTSYVAAYCDMGFAAAPVPDFAPSTAPSAVTAQALFTTISSGGGTSTLILAAAASNSATSQLVYQDDSWLLAAAQSASSASADGFAPIFVIPPGQYWFPHLPNLFGNKVEQRGTVYLTGLPLITVSHWTGYGGTGNLSGGAGQWSPINLSSHVGAAFVISAGLGDVENVSIEDISGDGIVIPPSGGGRFENIQISEATNGAGSPFRIDGNVIVLYGKNWTLQASQLAGGPPAIWFNRETATNPDSDIRITQSWLAYHTIKFDAPGGTNGNPNQLISIGESQTEENYDHGFVVVDGGASGSETVVEGLELLDVAEDTNLSNFDPAILTIGPKGASVTDAYGSLTSGTTVPGQYSGVTGLELGGGVSSGGHFGGNLGSGSGALPYTSGGGQGITGISDLGILANGNLGVMAPQNGTSGTVQWAQVVPPPLGGAAFAPTAITGTGSLAAGTYYYQVTCRNPDGGETAAGPEYVVTLASTGEINWTIDDAQAGCIGGLRFYRGTTSGGENAWLNKSGTYYTMGVGGLYAVSWTDDGTYTSNAATPPTSGNAFYSKLMMDGNSFSYLLADNPYLYSSNNTRLGIGTMTDPGSGSGIKLDVAGGTVRGQSGFVAGTSDPAFTNSPRAIYHAFIPALTSTVTAATLTLDKPITVTRVQAQAITAPSGCTTNAIVRVTDGTTPINVTLTAAANDSSAITQNYAANAVLTITVSTAAAGCSTSPANVNVEVQYRMQ